MSSIAPSLHARLVDAAHDAATAHPLDAESRRWLERLRGADPVRRAAVAELYERLRREAAFHIRRRSRGVSSFPRSDIDDLAAQAAGDALVAVLRKLDDYRGESQFWTWARRFAELEAPVSIRRRLGHDRVGISRHPEAADDVPDRGSSVHDRVESWDVLRQVTLAMRERLTRRQRTVFTAVAINGVDTATLARDLNTTPGAIYKSLHDARVKLRVAAGTG